MNGNNEKLFNLLTMCRRAGRMSLGFDASKESIEKRKSAAVLISSDLSEKTEKEIRFFSEKNGVPVIRCSFTIDEVQFGIGKKAGIISIDDEGFARKAIVLSESNE